MPRIATSVVIVSFVDAAPTDAGMFRCENLEPAARDRFTAHMTELAVVQTGLCTPNFLTELYSPGGAEAGCAVRYVFQPETRPGDTGFEPDALAASLADAAVRWRRLADHLLSASAFPAGYILAVAANPEFDIPAQSVTAVVSTVDFVQIEVPSSEVALTPA